MSNLSNKTEYRALSIIARMVKEYEKLHYLDMTASGDFQASTARNLLEGIIQNNGYRVNYARGGRGQRPLLIDHDNPTNNPIN